MFKNWDIDSDPRETFNGELIEIPKSKWGYLRDLKMYGGTTQDGEPTPENPVPMVSKPPSGDITSCGENWFYSDSNESGTAAGMAFVFNSETQIFSINGVATSEAGRQRAISTHRLVAGKTYTAKMYIVSGSAYRVLFTMNRRINGATAGGFVLLDSAQDYTTSFIAGENENMSVGWYWYSGSTASGFQTMLQIVEGQYTSETIPPYTPYLGSTTPYAVEGLDGTMYTTHSLPDGTRDEVDWDRNVLVKRVKQFVVTKDTPLAYAGYQGPYGAARINFEDFDNPAGVISGVHSGYSNMFFYSFNAYRINSFRANIAGDRTVISIAVDANDMLEVSSAGARAYVNTLIDEQGPIEFIYRLSTPQTIPLNPLPKIQTVQDDKCYIFDSNGTEISANAISYGG